MEVKVKTEKYRRLLLAKEQEVLAIAPKHHLGTSLPRQV
jgi:hypothetical protein